MYCQLIVPKVATKLLPIPHINTHIVGRKWLCSWFMHNWIGFKLSNWAL